jgi:anti-sigma B factor antagonist
MHLFLIPIRIGDVTVIDAAGRITLGADTALLRETIHELAEAGHNKIVLNLAGVTYIDSAGIGELVSAYVTFRGRGGAIKLVSLTERVQELMSTAKLHTIFEVFDDERKAVSSFAGNSSAGI